MKLDEIQQVSTAFLWSEYESLIYVEFHISYHHARSPPWLAKRSYADRQTLSPRYNFTIDMRLWVYAQGHWRMHVCAQGMTLYLLRSERLPDCWLSRDTLPIHQEEERTKIMRQLFGSLIEVGINLHFSAKGMSAHGLHCHCPVLSARM